MNGASGAYGAVAAARNIKNPFDAAYAILETGQHSLLVGTAADDFARRSGIAMVSNDYFTTSTNKSRWEARTGKSLEPSDDLETVGAVALDIHHNLAAAGSTEGLTCKSRGRIGDTAIIGAGLSADRNVAMVWYVPSTPVSNSPYLRFLVAVAEKTSYVTLFQKKLLLRMARTASKSV